LPYSFLKPKGVTVAVVNDTSDNSISSAAVSNANMYYFSWASFVTAVILFVNFARHQFGLNLVDELSGRGARLNPWSALLATSLVVAGASARVLNNDVSLAVDDRFVASCFELCLETLSNRWLFF
jgi:hypothetical protein